jgi:peptidoglycan-associated lipoprotein
VLIEGHADQRGTTDYNLALSERRAKASMNYLVSRGVRANRISVLSYGKERPMCTQTSEDCYSQNRRAHFAVKAK